MHDPFAAYDLNLLSGLTLGRRQVFLTWGCRLSLHIRPGGSKIALVWLLYDTCSRMLRIRLGGCGHAPQEKFWEFDALTSEAFLGLKTSLGTSGIHHHQTRSKIPGYQWIPVHPQPKRQRGAVSLEMYQQTVQGKSCYQWRRWADFSQQPPWQWAQPCWGGSEQGCSRNEDKSQIRKLFDSKDLCPDFKDCGWWWRSSCHLAYLELYKDITLPEPPTEIPSYARICRGV